MGIKIHISNKLIRNLAYLVIISLHFQSQDLFYTKTLTIIHNLDGDHHVSLLQRLFGHIYFKNVRKKNSQYF